MKKLLLSAITLIGLHAGAQAQDVTIINSRRCLVDVKLVGTTPGGSCGDYIVHLFVGAGSSSSYTIATIGGASVPPAPPPPAGITWNYAEIQNNTDCCDGGGLGVGGPINCVNPVTGLLMYPGPTACSTSTPAPCNDFNPFCASWTYPGPAPADIQIFCY